MKKITTPIIAALCLAAAVTVGLISQQTATASEPVNAAENAAKIGDVAPTFTLKDVKTDGDVSLGDYKGKVVVLAFHSTSCPWYKMSKDSAYDRVFVKMVEAYEDKDVVFLGVNSNRTESVEKVKKYVEKHDINYAVIKDPGNKVADAYNARSTPHVMVIDKDGKLRYRGGVEKRPANPKLCGESDEQYLGPVIDALLDGEEPPYTETKPAGCGIKRV